jgi:hypothetical protein
MNIKHGQIERLARALGVEFSAGATALYEGGHEGLEQLVDHHFDVLAESEEKQLGDAWAARLGAESSFTGKPADQKDLAR